MATTEDILNVTNVLEEGDVEMQKINVPGLIAIIVFYLLILGVGIFAAWRRKNASSSGSEEVMLAGRDIGYFIGILTMTATWVGGGYINGSAEAIFTSGLFWCQAPFGYAISLTLGGFFFARKMRDARYVTMLDPLQDCFGRRWGAMLYLPALAGETLWSGAILGALGTTLAVILDLGNVWSIIISAAIAVFYTLFGGLYSVAYTDVVQLFCIFIGLWITVPFAWMNKHVASLDPSVTDWVGSVPTEARPWGLWTDYAFLYIFGGIPWQVYFQRVLSSRTSKQAEVLSYAASFGCFIMAVPACILGAIGKGADWDAVPSYTKNITSSDQQKLILPLVMQHLTPGWVAFLGLGAVSAAVMSSADSSVLSASSMFTNNIYKNIIRQTASEREMIWIMRIAVIVVASVASFVAISSDSVYDLFHLCGDFVYVMLFPQFTLAVHAPHHVNTYGSIAAYFLGFTLRILGGESVLGIKPVIRYPFFKDTPEGGKQYFPFRSLSMLVTLVTLITVSKLTQALYDAGYFCDFLKVFTEDSDVIVIRKDIRDPAGLDNPALDHPKSNGNKKKEHFEMTNF